jgi:hypothetical protein
MMEGELPYLQDGARNVKQNWNTRFIIRGGGQINVIKYVGYVLILGNRYPRGQKRKYPRQQLAVRIQCMVVIIHQR